MTNQKSTPSRKAVAGRMQIGGLSRSDLQLDVVPGAGATIHKGLRMNGTADALANDEGVDAKLFRRQAARIAGVIAKRDRDTAERFSEYTQELLANMPSGLVYLWEGDKRNIGLIDQFRKGGHHG